MSVPLEIRAAARHILCMREPSAKAAAAQALAQRLGSSPLNPRRDFALLAAIPGRPERPALVAPQQVPMRSPFTLVGRAALLHAIAHIEFNAINLALDAVWRFPGLPRSFYQDWVQVAAEEGLHFTLLNAHLASLGHCYGDFDAHNGLWDMAQRTAHHLAARMALVPRVLEARGLDVTPGLQAKFAQAGDTRAAEILAVILHDEIGHVAVGNRWYHWCCEREHLDPVMFSQRMADEHHAPPARPPINQAARLAAGFSPAELALMATPPIQRTKLMPGLV